MVEVEEGKNKRSKPLDHDESQKYSGKQGKKQLKKKSWGNDQSSVSAISPKTLSGP